MGFAKIKGELVSRIGHRVNYKSFMGVKTFKLSAKKYLQSRRIFLSVAEKTDWLFGNDNFVGRIGEFIAYQYLKEQNRNPQRPKRKIEKGFDFLCDGTRTKVSVKTITFENNAGSTTRILEPWDELILITINEKIKIDKLGIITKEEFYQAIAQGHLKTKIPVARRSMVAPKGLISVYGHLVDKKITNRYL